MAENNHNLDGIQAPTLEETTYDPSKAVKRSLDDIQAPVLEDTAYIPEKKTAGLHDVAAPVLEDTFTPGAAPVQQAQPQFQQYGAPAQPAQPQFQQYGVPAQPVQSQQFQQYGAPAQPVQSQQFQQYGAPAQSVQSQQFQQYGAPAQPVQSQQFQQYGAPAQSVQSQQFQQYSAPAQQPGHTLNDVQKPVLDDEPPAQQRYVPKFVDPDLEAAKKTAVDRAIKSSLNSVPESFDEEKSREAYREFMREKDADLAKKGGMFVILIMVAGMISGLVTLLFSFGELKESAPAIIDTFKMCYMIMGILFIGGAAAMLVKSNTTRKIASNVFTWGTILHVIPGVFVMFGMQNKVPSVPLWLAVLVLNIIICFTYGSSEAIKKHYNGHGNETYY